MCGQPNSLTSFYFVCCKRICFVRVFISLMALYIYFSSSSVVVVFFFRSIFIKFSWYLVSLLVLCLVTLILQSLQLLLVVVLLLVVLRSMYSFCSHYFCSCHSVIHSLDHKCVPFDISAFQFSNIFDHVS